MNSALDFFESERLVGLLAGDVVEKSVGGHLPIAPFSGPLLRCRHQFPTDSRPAQVRIDVPALNVRCRPRAPLGVLADGELEKAGQSAARPLPDEHLSR